MSWPGEAIPPQTVPFWVSMGPDCRAQRTVVGAPFFLQGSWHSILHHCRQPDRSPSPKQNDLQRTSSLEAAGISRSQALTPSTSINRWRCGPQPWLPTLVLFDHATNSILITEPIYHV